MTRTNVRNGWWADEFADRVLAAVEYDGARTAIEVAAAAFGTDAWEQRQNVRNVLYRLADEGVVICDEERPLRFLRPDPTLAVTR